MAFLAVGLGGFLGSCARYAVGLVALRLLPATFPFGTTLVNVTGCFAIGVLAVASQGRFLADPGARLFWIVGVLGGYTTFSTFGYETVALAAQGRLALAAANVAAQLGLGLAAVWAGGAVVRTLS